MDDNVQGAIKILGHLITIQLWVEQGGAWESLVAWCKTCDRTGINLMQVNVRDVDNPVEMFDALMRQVSEHAFTWRQL